jgi:hypothetical protein
MKHIGILAVLAILSACSTSGKQENTVTREEAGLWPPSVGEVALHRAQQSAENTRLDLGLIVFEPGIPEDESIHSAREIFPKIREVEARYLPVVLREALVASNNWGVVRVVPEDDKTLELRVTGEIIHSDGIDLVLQIKAYDATGRLWLDRIYHDQTSQSDYPAIARDDPYGDIYRKIANDLGEFKNQLNPEKLATIRNVALLRYAASLSPEAFSDFLAESENGQIALRRLPTEDDPMMVRVQRIRNQEYLFIDTVDEQYVALHAEMGPTYYLWRQYGRERAIFKDDYGERAANRDSYGKRGSFIAMEQTYNAFKNTKIQDQDLKELAGGFNNEVAPTVMEVNGRVFRLSGGLDAQYAEWREILRSIFSLETGLPILEK